MADPIVSGLSPLTQNEIDNLVDLQDGLQVFNLDTGAVETYSSTLAAWKPANRPSSTLNVSADGGDFTSIKDALDFVAGETPLSTNRWEVKVGAGIYTEDPFTIPIYTTLNSSNATVINASDELNELITMSDNSILCGGNIVDGPASNFAVLCPDNGVYTVKDFKIAGSQGGILSDGANSLTTIFTTIVDENVLPAFRATNGSSMAVNYSSTMPASTSSIEALSSATITASNCNLLKPAIALNADGGNIIINDVYVEGADTTIQLNNGGVVSGTGLQARNTTVLDLNQIDNGSSIRLSSSLMNSGLFSIANWQNVNMDYNEEEPFISGYTISQGLNVGLPEFGRKSYIGSGPPFIRGLQVWTETDLGVFEDVTAKALDITGQTYTFPGTAVNNAIYISTDVSDTSGPIQFFAIGNVITVPAIAAAGDIVTEYWDGAWIEMGAMAFENTPPNAPHNLEFYNRAGEHGVQFDQRISSSWIINDPMVRGTFSHWIRFRIAATITQVPQILFSLTVANTNVTGEDGWKFFYGSARPLGTLPWDIGQIHPAASSPGNQDLYLSKELDAGRIENFFTNASNSRITFATPLPLDCDTSTKIELDWSIITDDNSAGNIDWVIRSGFSNDGDNVYRTQGAAPPLSAFQETQNISVAAPVTADTEVTYSALIDIKRLTPVRATPPMSGSNLWVSIERDGTGDSHSGDVAIIQISGLYLRWNNGAHL